MKGGREGADGPRRGLFARLARDVRANTMAMMAIAMIPMAALAGSAVDTARLYVVKVRLQQACDAGVLAGRKTMDTNSASPTLDANAVTQAKAFFANNFISGYLGTPTFTSTTTPYPFVPTKTTDSQVAGTASISVPMTLMAMFGSASQTITVTCQARYDLADTDIVFVLDTTGSMACLPSDDDPTCTTYVNNQVKNGKIVGYTRPADGSLGASSGSTGSANDSVAGYPGSQGYYVPEKDGSRIAAVRQAVVNFYTTVANNADKSTHVRYGFVTYSSTVNAGKAIMNASPSYMVGGSGTSGLKTWSYQSRFIDPNKVSQYQVSQSSTTDATTQANCTGSTRTPAATGNQPYTFDRSSSASVVTKAWIASQGKCGVTTTVYGPLWTYGPATYDVSSYLTNTSVDDPSKLDGTTNSWQGCIEERDTTAGVSSFSSGALPPDLDPDLIPSSDATRWRPMWPDVIYWRNYDLTGNNGWFGSTGNVTDTAANNGDADNTAFYTSQSSSYQTPNAFSLGYYSSGSLVKSGIISCGKPIRRVATMTQQDVTNYVNAADFRPIGGTYHDAGMIWGTRLLSTVGVFGGDVGAWPGRQATNKVIVFLTDGSMAPSLTTYGLYGAEYFDKRVTGGDYAPPAAASPNTQQTAYHNARFLAACSKAKSMNVNVWTIMITTDAVPSDPLKQCATTNGQALVSSSGDDLNSKFQAIAKQVAMLRISQ